MSDLSNQLLSMVFNNFSIVQKFSSELLNVYRSDYFKTQHSLEP